MNFSVGNFEVVGFSCSFLHFIVKIEYDPYSWARFPGKCFTWFRLFLWNKFWPGDDRL